ncbi:MAG: hypothetical protein Q7T82_10210 [Armatimonadota bacterium]|nr:hypothetical protein [Armatimonadota bacterium]
MRGVRWRVIAVIYAALFAVAVPVSYLSPVWPRTLVGPILGGICGILLYHEIQRGAIAPVALKMDPNRGTKHRQS